MSKESAPAYKLDSVLGKLQHRVADPLAHTLSPIGRALQPVTVPLGGLGHEAYAAFTSEGAMKRKAGTIEAVRDRFATDEAKGAMLLGDSVALLEEMDAGGGEPTDAAFARMSGICFEMEKWLPETYFNFSINPKTESFRTMIQDLMAGYLFHRNALLFKAEGKTLDEAKADRQVRGVAAMLLGHHVHMGTGEGKSTVVLPIVSLIQARTSREKDVVLCTASEQNVAELIKSVERLGNELPPGVACSPETYEFDLETGKGQQSDIEALQKRMQREAVLRGSYSRDTQQQVRDLYWKDQMESQLAESRSDKLRNKSGAGRILLATERDMVFAFEEDPGAFVKTAPVILMDEADIPYRRQTPYVTTTEAQYYSPQEVQDAMGEWLLQYVINDRIHYPTEEDEGDFIPTESGFSLTDGAKTRLSSLNLRNFIDNWGSHSAAKRAFKKGVRKIAAHLDISTPQDIVQMEKQMRAWFRDNLPSSELPPQEEGVQVPEEERITDMQAFVYTAAERLGAQYYERGVGYLLEDGSSEVKIRDAYIDDLLIGHRHQPQVQTAILAMNGQYAFVPPYRTAGRSIHFQTFVASQRDRIRCASGSLLFPDLLTRKIKKEAFASFLEEATGKDVVLISPPDIKKAPVPVLAKTVTQGMDRLVTDVSHRDQPRLVICYDRFEGEAILEKLAVANPGKKIVYVPIHPSPEEVSGYCRDLAEGTIDVLISAGNLGFGVNIVKANGEFPDLHVSLFGLPENQLQVVQALGRRRKPGADFSWYVAEPTIYKYMGDFKAGTSWRERVIQGYLSVEQMMQGYAEVRREPAKGLVFVADLLHQHEVVRRSDDAYVIYFDQMMDTVRRYAFEKMESLVGQDAGVTAPASGLGHVMKELEARSPGISRSRLSGSLDAARRRQWIRQNMASVVSQYGLPDDLDTDMQHELATVSASLQAQNMKDLITSKFPTYLFNSLRQGQSLIDRYIEDWYEKRRAGMEEMIGVLSDGYRLQRMFPAVLSPAGEELARAASIQPTPQLEQAVRSLFQPLSLAESLLPSGMTLGFLALEGHRFLSIKQDDRILIVSSYDRTERGFGWEVGDVYDRVGMNLLGSPIGNGLAGNSSLFCLWTSKL